MVARLSLIFGIRRAPRSGNDWQQSISIPAGRHARLDASPLRIFNEKAAKIRADPLGPGDVMDISHIPLFAALNKRMSWLNERQVVLAENVANVETPGYTAQDLKQPDFSDLVAASGAGGGKLAMLTSTSGHIGGNGAAQGGFQLEKMPGDTTPAGNNVQLDQQALKVSQNASDFSLMETLYHTQLGLLKMALGGGGGSSS
jgi:flagellar basal-body rod protein FlgB